MAVAICPEKELDLPKGLIPLMVIVQEHKLWPVLEYCEFIEFVEAFTANVDVCMQKLREWQQQGCNVLLLDLRKAYLQIHVSDWFSRFTDFFFLTRLGF